MNGSRLVQWERQAAKALHLPLVLGLLPLSLAASPVRAATGQRAARPHPAAAHPKATRTAASSGASLGILSGATGLEIAPATATLDGPHASQHVVVTAALKDGSTADATDRVTFVVGNAKLAKVAGAVLLPVADGETRVVARLGRLTTAPVTVTVRNAQTPPRVEFVNDIMPILAKAGCNSTACHGSPVGKGGFKLSLFGYEPAADQAAIVQGSGGRRVNLTEPAKSLLLLKPTAGIAHGGGQRFKANGPEARTILAWLTAGAPGVAGSEARVSKVDVLPAQPWMPAPGSKQRLIVSATMSNGAIRDATDKALFSSNDDGIAAVDENGVVTANRPGETAIMVRYLGQVGVARVSVLPPWKLQPSPRLIQSNYIDALVQAKLQKLRMVPSDLCTDEAFIRRATLDTCGIIPAADEVRAFVADRAPDKRAKLIDRLLDRSEFVDLWTLKWEDTLRNNPRLTRESLLDYHNWIHEQIQKNRPYNEFVRDLLTAAGKTADTKIDPENLPRQLQLQKERNPKQVERLVEELNSTPYNPASSYYVVTRDPLELASATSQIFLGVRIECARCHNHPFEKWTQDDYYHLAAFFNGVTVRGNNQTPRVVSVNMEARPLRRPETNQLVEPRALDGAEVKLEPGADRRAALASWITAPDNPFFARAAVNRIWAHYFGRGIVEPIDDFRVTNPPANPELLDALAKELVSHNFDVKAIHRVVLNSRTYQQSSQPNRFNRQDTGNFARFYPRRMMAEQLYDSISQATGVFLQMGNPARRGPAKTAVGPYGMDLESLGPITRVAQLPTLPAGVRGRGGTNVRVFLDTFGKPRREVVCTCERSADGNIGQALALINGGDLNAKIDAPEGRVRQLIASAKPDPSVIEELYVAVLSRRPTIAETAEAASLIRSAKTRPEGIEDLMWSLLNSREFLFVH